MPCGDDLKTLLSRHVDGELSPDERARVDEHLAGCEPCRELLALFQKNESLLGNALSTESFGNAVIESVIGEIKREGVPVEAKPVEEGAWEWFRSRPVLQFAAMGLVTVGLVLVLHASHGRQLATIKERLDGAGAQIQRMRETHQIQVQLAGRQSDDYESLIRALRAEDAIRHAGERWALGFVDPGAPRPQKLIVRASFDPKTYKTFDVYRRGENESPEGYAKLNGAARLESPEFIDATAKPGLGYVYKFRAYSNGKEDAYLESFPIVMRLPAVPRLDPEKSIGVRCVEIAKTKKLAVFTLERVVNGKSVSETFYVEPGQRLGEIRDVVGAGRVDFRTNLLLESMDNGEQTMSVSYTRPLLDKDGKPVLDHFENEVFVPKTVQHDEVLSTRPNSFALFRPMAPGQGKVDLWKGSWMQVRAQE